eukprot:8665045-Pyramimonas_sp.AAC.1
MNFGFLRIRHAVASRPCHRGARRVRGKGRPAGGWGVSRTCACLMLESIIPLLLLLLLLSSS